MFSYDPEQHQEVIEDYAKIEVAKQAVKAQKLQEELLTGKMTEADVSTQVMQPNCNNSINSSFFIEFVFVPVFNINKNGFGWFCIYSISTAVSKEQ